MSGIVIRRAAEGDVAGGLLRSLRSLSASAGSTGEKEGRAALRRIGSNPLHTVFVAEAGGEVVGAATIIVEPKVIHGGGAAGHIEDVAVREDAQGKGVGKMLVRACLERAAEAGCYKTILDCEDGVVPFYEGMGFRRRSNGMRFDHGAGGSG